LDSHYFQWGILLKAREAQKDKIQTAKEFFDWLDKTKATIVVPTPIVTELLMGATVEERTKILTELDSRFYVKEFDIQAAKIAADIWNKKKADKVIEELRKSGESMRTKIKIDLQILAIALAANVTTLYTEDGNLEKLADGLPILCRKMPLQAQITFLDALVSTSVSEPPSGQSLSASPATSEPPEPSLPSAPQGDQGQPPQDS
jgi:rRNA maturation endonuclease Nob1